MNKYERHIKELCKKYRIEIRYTTKGNCANQYSKIIWITKRIKSIKTYVGALHEVSHIINEHPFVNDNLFKVIWNNARSNNVDYYTSEYVMGIERDAWRTTKKLAKWWNETADRTAIECLLTYAYGYNKCHKRPFMGEITNYMILKKLLPCLSHDKELVSILANDFYG